MILVLKENSKEQKVDALIEMGWCYTYDNQMDQAKTVMGDIDSLLSGSNDHHLLGRLLFAKRFLLQFK